MPSYDYFSAELRCPICGKVSRLQEQTKIGTQDLELLRVGDDIGATLDDVRSFYYELHTPDPDGPIRIMIRWDCRLDHTGLRDRVLWALVTLEKGKITSIQDVRPDREALETVHFVDDEANAALHRHFGWRLAPGQPAPDRAAEQLAEAIRRDEG